MSIALNAERYERLSMEQREDRYDFSRYRTNLAIALRSPVNCLVVAPRQVGKTSAILYALHNHPRYKLVTYTHREEIDLQRRHPHLADQIVCARSLRGSVRSYDKLYIDEILRFGTEDIENILAAMYRQPEGVVIGVSSPNRDFSTMRLCVETLFNDNVINVMTTTIQENLLPEELFTL